MSVQADSNLLLAELGPMKNAACYFLAIFSVFPRLSGARHCGEALHPIAASDAGRCAFAIVQRHLCWCSLQTVLAGGRRAAQPTNSCAASALHLQLPG